MVCFLSLVEKALCLKILHQTTNRNNVEQEKQKEIQFCNYIFTNVPYLGILYNGFFRVTVIFTFFVNGFSRCFFSQFNIDSKRSLNQFELLYNPIYSQTIFFTLLLFFTPRLEIIGCAHTCGANVVTSLELNFTGTISHSLFS